MKESTVIKYTDFLQQVKESGLSLSVYCSKNTDYKYNSITSAIAHIKKQFDVNSENIAKLLGIYKEVTTDKNYMEVEQPIEDTEQGIIVDFIRDEQNRIIKYDITVPVKDSIPFHTILSREKAETIFGLYVYYGGNVTARNVANEFPEYTLPEIKHIFKAFRLYKDSMWAPRHLLEELTVQQLSEYRMRLKERAAFKYADATQERDFKNTINKMALQINKLEDRNEFIKELINANHKYKEYNLRDLSISNKKTGVIVLSDLHVGACNVANGYLPLVEYNDKEIKARLNKILDFLYTKINDWEELIILNLGDSIDNYRGTTAKGTPLPTDMTEKQAAKMYLELMEEWFIELSNTYHNIKYICTGDSNHGASFDWITNVALTSKINKLGIDCYVSDDPIDSFNVGEFTITYLHGHDSRTQYKGFPLNLDERTKNWFNNYFLQSDFNFKQNRIVLKGDLHQYSVNSCNTFDYINAPSLYGSSAYIVGNFGKGKEGTLYLEIDNNKYVNGVIWNE